MVNFQSVSDTSSPSLTSQIEDIAVPISQKLKIMELIVANWSQGNWNWNITL